MLLIDKLTNKVDFSKSEIIIADFIIQLGEKIKNYSARSIAKETYTSPATVLNLCKKIGIEGFDNFKKAYLNEIEYLNQQFGTVDPNLPLIKEILFLKLLIKWVLYMKKQLKIHYLYYIMIYFKKLCNY